MSQKQNFPDLVLKVAAVLLIIGYVVFHLVQSGPLLSSSKKVYDAVSAEGFSFKGAHTLHMHGQKSKDISMEVAMAYDTMSPICRGMFATDTGDTNKVSKPQRGGSGEFFKLYYVEEGEDKYELFLPLEVSHPECDWRLYEMEIKMRSSFTKRPYGSYRNDGNIFQNWNFILPENAARGSRIHREELPQLVDAQCFNNTFGRDSKTVDCGAKGWPWHTNFPQKLTGQNHDLTFNFSLHPDIIDSDAFYKMGKAMPWDEVTDIKGYKNRPE